MKKLYTTVLIFSSFSSLTFAQMRVGVLGGVNSSSILETNKIPGWDVSMRPGYKSRAGLNLGILAEIPLGNHDKWFIHSGFTYQAKGRKFSLINDSATASQSDTLSENNHFIANYIEIPLNLVFKIPLGKKNKFILSAGPYVSFFYSGKEIYETRFYSSGFSRNEKLIEVGNENGKINTFDAGVNARAGFEFGNVLLTGFYSRGFTDFYHAAYDASFKNKVIGASVGFWLNKGPVRIKKVVVTDSDNDGIIDMQDKCPDMWGIVKYEGCPVPDSDKDGLSDEEDKCPTVSGFQKYDGCPVPDSDNDGLNDESDACPEIAGIIEFNGCPIPDSDGDGVNDKQDKCPTEAGIKENDGCPAIKKEIVDKVNYAAQNIFFPVGSDVINSASFESLDQVALILKEQPALQLEIQGHTDNTGLSVNNLVLSQKRANAVKKYLLSKQIAQTRMYAIGYGDEKPLTDNNSSESKAKNRRVELLLIQ